MFELGVLLQDVPVELLDLDIRRTVLHPVVGLLEKDILAITELTRFFLVAMSLRKRTEQWPYLGRKMLPGSAGLHLLRRNW